MDNLNCGDQLYQRDRSSDLSPCLAPATIASALPYVKLLCGMHAARKDAGSSGPEASDCNLFYAGSGNEPEAAQIQSVCGTSGPEASDCNLFYAGSGSEPKEAQHHRACGLCASVNSNSNTSAQVGVIYAEAGSVMGATLNLVKIIRTRSFPLRSSFHISKDGGNPCKKFKNLWHIVMYKWGYVKLENTSVGQGKQILHRLQLLSSCLNLL